MAVMVPFEVCNTANDNRFYVNADSAQVAIERVALALGNVGSVKTWIAVPASSALTLVAGVVFDESGRPIKLSINTKMMPDLTNPASTG